MTSRKRIRTQHPDMLLLPLRDLLAARYLHDLIDARTDLLELADAATPQDRMGVFHAWALLEDLVGEDVVELALVLRSQQLAERPCHGGRTPSCPDPLYHYHLAMDMALSALGGVA